MKLTLAKLNDTIWYRLLKVIFCLFFVFATAINFLVTKEYPYEYNTEYTRIICEEDADRELHDLKKTTLGVANEATYLQPEENQRILEKICGLDEATAQKYLDSYNTICQFVTSETALSCSNGFTASMGVMRYSPAQHFLRFLPIELVLFAIFELFRRVFYYVITGKVRPKN